MVVCVFFFFFVTDKVTIVYNIDVTDAGSNPTQAEKKKPVHTEEKIINAHIRLHIVKCNLALYQNF